MGGRKVNCACGLVGCTTGINFDESALIAQGKNHSEVFMYLDPNTAVKLIGALREWINEKACKS